MASNYYKNNPSKSAANLSATQAQIKINKALEFHNKGELAKAQDLYVEILKIQPKHFEILHLLGIIAFQTKNYPRAVELISQAITLCSTNSTFYNNRGLAFQELKQWDAALADFIKAIGITPGYAEAYFNLGNLQQETLQLDAATDSFSKAIAIKPDFAEAYNNRGTVLQRLNQLQAAEESFKKAIAIQPGFAKAHNNHGNALKERGQPALAVESYKRAIAYKPDYAEAYSNCGAALTELNQPNAAVESCNKAIALQPDYAEAYWNKSLALLVAGDLVNGWKLYEWRWQYEKTKPFKRQFSQPLWLGIEPLKDKTILLHSEQGLGDTIQFCRYAASVAKLGARVIMEVHQSLIGVLKGLEGVAEFVAKGETLPVFDFHCYVLSLPLALKTNLNNIPNTSAYIRSNTSKVQYWAQKLGHKTAKRVGLVWSGSTVHKNDRNRSMTLLQLLPYLPSGNDYICLQKELRDTDKTTLQAHPHIQFYGDELNDFTDTAALCELMDVVISVDTSVAHLAGALGKPTWILLPFAPDWRWLLDRTDSPWYSSVKLYRQDAIDDWSSPFSRIQADLLKLTA